MYLIIISGPSGSGKSYLAKKLSNEFENVNIIKTDSFYRDNLLIKFLSIYLNDIYDRMISIKKEKLIDTLRSILNKENDISTYNYDFKSKKSSKLKMNMKNKSRNQILILEGIFSHRIIKHFESYIMIKILCIENKETCYKRRLRRDLIKRGRKRKEVEKRFEKSWEIFKIHSYNVNNDRDVLYINTKVKKQYESLINKIKLLNP